MFSLNNININNCNDCWLRSGNICMAMLQTTNTDVSKINIAKNIKAENRSIHCPLSSSIGTSDKKTSVTILDDTMPVSIIANQFIGKILIDVDDHTIKCDHENLGMVTQVLDNWHLRYKID